MIVNQVLCDFCGNPLPVEDGSVKLHRTKEWDTRLIFPHLCEKCAAKIDYVLLAEKNDAIKRGEISIKNTKLNAERRERLGTKG